MKKNYVEMNIDEMKKTKEVFKIHLRTYIHKLRFIKSIEETKENKYELKQLEASTCYCIDLIKSIIDIYKELIDLGELCELDESFFIKKINEVKRLHTNIQIENNKKQNQHLYIKYSLEVYSKKGNLNL